MITCCIFEMLTIERLVVINNVAVMIDHIR